jgi:3'-5' exonuclease
MKIFDSPNVTYYFYQVCYNFMHLTVVIRYELEVGYTEDLREVAAVKMGRHEIRQWGLQSLAREIMGVHMEKERRVRLSNWGKCTLSKEQIEYATVDAFVSFEVGRRLEVGDI